MSKQEVEVSIIIVHYRAKLTLFNCLNSLRQVLEKTKISHEIIVVDNDEEKVIEKEIEEKFPFLKYIKSTQNTGYGGGNNLGAQISKGKFIFFLNPDTVLLGNPIDELAPFLNKNNN